MAAPTEPADRLAGIDVGGSAIKLGVMARDGSARAERSLAVDPGRPAREILAEAARELRALGGAGLAGVGIGLPGLLDRDAGCIRHSPNLPWLEGVPVAASIAGELAVDPRAIRLENDANVAALGEQWLGAARGLDDVLVLTLGTGIGGGLILDGKLWTGAGLAGEIGHLVLEPAGEPCGCGALGCLETLASATAVRRRALRAGLPGAAGGDLERLVARARAHAGRERELLWEVGRDLGHGLAAVVSLLDLRRFVFGGGFSAALDLLEPGIRAGLEARAYGERTRTIELRRATLGNSAGWIGAARLVLG